MSSKTAPISKNTKPTSKPVAPPSALTHKLNDSKKSSSSSESKAAKKKKYLDKLKLSSEDERRAAIENGKIKFVHQELRKSNLKKIVANNCVIVGDNNNVIGNDNVLIGVNNKAVGNNNKIVAPSTTTVVPRTESTQPSTSTTTATTAAAATTVAPEQHPPSESYYSEEFLTLPDNWIQLNGIIIYRDADITTVLKWILRDWTFQGRPAFPEGTSMIRNFTITEAVYVCLPADLIEIVGRYNIPSKENSVAATQLRGFALAFGKIPMPADMPPSTRAPKVPQEHKITMPYFSRPATQASSSAIRDLRFEIPPGEEDAPTTLPPATSSRSNSSAPQHNKKPNFLPTPGVNSDNNLWKCSLLDLPGAADIAGDDEPTCKICLVNRMDVLFEPCHHLASCRDCAKKLVEINPIRQDCPVCRKKIEYATILYFD